MDIFVILCALACAIGIFWCLYVLFWPQKPQVIVMKNNVAGGDICAGDIFRGVSEKPTRLPDTITQLKTLREVKDTGPKIIPKRITRDIPRTDERYFTQTTHVDHGNSLADNITMAVIVHELLKDDPKPYTPPPAPQPVYEPEPEREETRRSYYESPAPAPYESPSVSSFTSSSDSYSSSSSSSSDSYSSSDSGSSGSWD